MLKTLYDRILVKRLEEETKTAGGLFIPEMSKEKSPEGVVVAVGDGTVDPAGNLRSPSVKPGDIVIFHPHAGSEIKDGEDSYLVMRENEILAVRT